jgi:hypothetical protein
MSTKSLQSKKLPGVNNIYREDLKADPTMSAAFWYSIVKMILEQRKNSTEAMIFISPYPQQRKYYADQKAKKRARPGKPGKIYVCLESA